MRPLFFLATASLILSPPCQAFFEADGACPLYIDDAILETLDMAAVASEALNKKAPVDASEEAGLYKALFNEMDRDVVKTIYDNIVKLRTSSASVVIFCDEDTIVWPDNRDKNTDTKAMFAHDAWIDNATGKKFTRPFGNGPQVTTPRATICESDPREYAYVLNGFKPAPPPPGANPKEYDTVDTSDQYHIILCPRVVKRQVWGDTRTAKDMKSGGLFPGNFKGPVSLDNLSPLSKVILHELTHTGAVGGLIERNVPFIDDGPDGYAYGLTALVDLRSKANSGVLANVADSYSIFGVALYLQFQDKFPGFTWSTGSINEDYSPYDAGPLAKRALRAVRVMGERAVLRSREMAITASMMVGDRWRTFSA